MINYEWDCKTVEVVSESGDYTNVVFKVTWIYNGTSDQLDAEERAYRSRRAGTIFLEAPSTSDFTPLEELTEETVVGWVTSSLGEETIANLELSIAEAIDAEMNPTSFTFDVPQTSTMPSEE